MGKALKRRLAVAIAVIAVLSGGAVAAVSATGQGSGPKRVRVHNIAAGGGAARRDALGALGAAAAYLGIPASHLREQLRAGKTLAQVAAATPGKSEAGLIATLVAARMTKLSRARATVVQSVSAQVNKPLLGVSRRRGGARGVAAAARLYLGLPSTQLRSLMRSGHTLAQIANATPGKSEAGLIGAIVAAKSTRLTAAVNAGKLTPASESAHLARLTKRVQAAVNRVHSAKKHRAKRSG